MQGGPDPSIGRLLIEVTRAHRAVFAAELAKLGLHVGQELVLIEIGLEDGLTQAVLTQRLGVERATVSRALTRLQRAGFVQREKQGASAQIRLTGSGRQVLPKAQTLWRALDQELRDAAEGDVETLIAGLGRMRDHLKTRGLDTKDARNEPS